MRLERTVSWSQTRRDTNFAIPGYSLFCHDTTANGKNKDFSVCGHSCGQSRFCAAFGNRGKSRKRRRCKALRRFALPRPGYRHGTPKPRAPPSAIPGCCKMRRIITLCLHKTSLLYRLFRAVARIICAVLHAFVQIFPRGALSLPRARAEAHHADAANSSLHFPP